MLPSAVKFNNANSEIFAKNSNILSENEKLKYSIRNCRIGRKQNILIVYIYMWITIFCICCNGLPPVIKIGMYFYTFFYLFIYLFFEKQNLKICTLFLKKTQNN